MGYQALLFCPDEKTARTVTQVLSELEFSVEPCTEPFAAVKKLMGQHFDAIIVDCDNEQNATLLFKSARNSTSNQASLAVAVVEGQAGVAKAFRIGANLVLTKPINVEQAKGTLRVARGLLRKGDPAKGVVPTPAAPQNSAPTATPAMPAKVAPRTPASGDVMGWGGPSQPAKPFVNTGTPPTAIPATKAASPVSATDDDDVIEIDGPETTPAPSRNTAAASSMLKPGALFSKPETAPEPPPSAASRSAKDIAPPNSIGPMGSAFGAGPGSAAAPARSPQKFPVGSISKAETQAEAFFEKPNDSGNIGSSAPLPPPSFSFGGADAAGEQSTGGSKKALIGVAAAVVIAAGLYLGWTQFQGKHSPPKEGLSVVTTPANPAPAKGTPAAPSSTPASEPTSPVSLSPAQPTSQPTPQKLTEVPVAESSLHTPDKTAAAKSPAKTSASISGPIAKSNVDAEPSAQPIVVKNGTTVSPARTPTVGSDAAAPSVLDVAPSPSGGSLSNLLSNPGDSSKPVLQALNVSQGVSQGLLIKKVQPTYPPAAIRMHLEGSVQLLATIGKTGNITAVKVQGGEPLLAQAALDAVKQWKYKPYYLNGDPVEIQTQVTINFKLPR